jgi:glycosyltransferase involved in cell wall biosynthesis
MRIAYILTSLGIGGAEKQVLALAERMAQRRHAVLLLVLCERQPNQWPAMDVDVRYLGMRKTPLAILRGLLRARRILIEFKPDLVHSHTYPANMTARLLRLVGVAPAVLATIHNVYEGGVLRMLAYCATDWLSVHTTAVSAAAARRFTRLHAVPVRKCSVVPNAIDVEGFVPNAERRQYMRGKQGAGSDFIWMAAGRITAAKDYPNLLRAFAQVRAVEPRTQLWIAGEGSASAEQALRHAVADSTYPEAIRLLGLRRDVPDLLDAADGFVLSSAWEGMPLIVGEAMAMEKPVVATDVGGVREIVGNAGEIVSAKASPALAEAMGLIMHLSPADFHARGHAARLRIQEKFSMEARVTEWEILYDELMRRRRQHNGAFPQAEVAEGEFHKG